MRVHCMCLSICRFLIEMRYKKKNTATVIMLSPTSIICNKIGAIDLNFAENHHGISYEPISDLPRS